MSASSSSSSSSSIANGSYGSSSFDLTKATVLITGGSSGIGLGFVPLFLDAGSKVVIVGRRVDALQAAQKQYPSINILQGDVTTGESRQKLFSDVKSKYPDVNIVFNNAGVSAKCDNLAGTPAPRSDVQSVIDINFSSVVHLSTLFVPHLLSKSESAIVNVSSSLAFYTLLGGLTYSATKAAVHSYTMSLRYQLANTSIRVVELVPPAVKSNLLGPGVNHAFGHPTADYCQATFDRFVRGEYEIGYKESDEARLASREERDLKVMDMAKRMKAAQVVQA